MKKLLLYIVAVTFLSTPVVGLCASVTPSLIELEANQEELVESSITIINSSAVDQTYYLDTMIFMANDVSGTPQFLSKEQDFSGLATWINFPSDSVVVPAGSKGEVLFELFVPDTAPAGGHYAAITVSSAPEDVVASNGAIIDAKTAVLILLTVSGEQEISAQILDFIQTSADGISSNLGGAFEFRIQNQGDAHILPVGAIELKDMFGRTLMQADANEAQGRVLPGSTRTYQTEVQTGVTGWMETISAQIENLAIGPITAVLSLEYGDGQQLSAEIDAFQYVPWQLLVSLACLLIIFLAFYRLGSRKAKR